MSLRPPQEHPILQSDPCLTSTSTLAPAADWNLASPGSAASLEIEISPQIWQRSWSVSVSCLYQACVMKHSGCWLSASRPAPPCQPSDFATTEPHPVVKSRHMDSHYQIVPIHAFQSIFESSSGQSECFSLPTYSVPCNMRLLLP